MGAEGIWKVEVLASYGWESVSTAFLENGRYLGASQDHYVIGRYEVDGDRIRVEGVSNAHGDALNLFGVTDKQLAMTFNGVIDGDQVDGEAEDDEGRFTVTFRARRLAQWP